MISFTFVGVILSSDIFRSSTIVEGLKTNRIIEFNINAIVGMLNRDWILRIQQSEDWNRLFQFDVIWEKQLGKIDYLQKYLEGIEFCQNRRIKWISWNAFTANSELHYLSLSMTNRFLCSRIEMKKTILAGRYSLRSQSKRNRRFSTRNQTWIQQSGWYEKVSLSHSLGGEEEEDCSLREVLIGFRWTSISQWFLPSQVHLSTSMNRIFGSDFSLFDWWSSFQWRYSVISTDHSLHKKLSLGQVKLL